MGILSFQLHGKWNPHLLGLGETGGKAPLALQVLLSVSCECNSELAPEPKPAHPRVQSPGLFLGRSSPPLLVSLPAFLWVLAGCHFCRAVPCGPSAYIDPLYSSPLSILPSFLSFLEILFI